jgi:hypothetical protein
MKNWITVVLILSLFSSGILCCVPDPLPVNGIPVVQSQIAVSSQMLPDGSLVVVLTKTFGVLDVSENSNPQDVLEQLAISDATVTVTGPRGVDTLTQLDHGVYFSIELVLVPGEAYSLHVKSPTMGMVTAVTTVIEGAHFDSITINHNKQGRSDLTQITYSAVDPLVENYYLLTVQKIQRTNLEKNIFSGGVFSHLVDDKDFNGQTFREQFNVVPGNYAKGDTIAVSISNISKAYYDFMKLRVSSSKSIVEYLSEPVHYPSNVVGGKGFFNLYLSDLRLLTLNQ